MIKKGISRLSVVVLAVLMGITVPMARVSATEETTEATSELTSETANEAASELTNETESEPETEPETEPPLPDSYYLQIESNEIANWPQGPQVEAEAAVVMDAETGAFLYSKNMESKQFPASMTKVMTTLVAIENGDLKSKVKFSEEAIHSLDPDSSRLWMEVGERISLERALYGVMLASANDCSNAVGEKVGGTIENFVQMMNDKAKELGCTNTNFTNTHGLHNENHYTSARDMAIIMQAAMENKTFAKIAKTVEYSYPKTNKMDEKRYFMNHHKMLQDGDFYYEDCIGGKTGYTSDSLNTLVTAAKRDKRTLICVVLRTNGSSKTFNETRMLLEYGFDNFKNKKVTNLEGSKTRADILGISYFNKEGYLLPDILKESTVIVKPKVKVTIPKEVDISEVERKYSADKGIAYNYHEQEIGQTPLAFQGLNYEIPKRTIIHELPVLETETMEETETEVEDSTIQKMGGILQGGLVSVKQIWNQGVEWIYANDVVVAAVGLILILALLPVLIVAYVRSRKSGNIRKQRKQEKEKLVQQEEAIESKSALEIEAEIRAELEKEKEKQRREEARKLAAEEAEKQIKEMEAVIEGKTEAGSRLEKLEEDNESAKAEEDSQLEKLEEDSESAKAEEDNQLEKLEEDSESVKAEEDNQLEKLEEDSESAKAEEDSQLEKLEEDSESAKTEEDSQLEKLEEDNESAKAEEDSQLEKLEEDSESAK